MPFNFSPLPLIKTIQCSLFCSNFSISWTAFPSLFQEHLPLRISTDRCVTEALLARASILSSLSELLAVSYLLISLVFVSYGYSFIKYNIQPISPFFFTLLPSPSNL